MKKIIFIAATIMLIVSCSLKTHFRTVKDKKYTWEGDIDKDGIKNGPINVYDSLGHLYAKINYTDNYRNGNALYYYPNGVLKEDDNFYFNELIGLRTCYDSLGRLSFKQNYYLGNPLGACYLYDTLKRLKTYQFKDFEGQSIYQNDFDSAGKRLNVAGNLINLVLSNALNKQQLGNNLFLYLLNPPKMKLDYKICIMDTSKAIKDYKTIYKSIFYKTFLPSLPKGETYFVQLSMYDSLNNTSQVMIKDVL